MKLLRLLPVSVLSAVFYTSSAFAAAEQTGCTGKNCLDSPSQLNIPTVGLAGGISTIINILTTTAAVIATIFLVIGGIKFATSSGNPQSIGSAKQTITYALIGLAVAILARVLVGFVLSRGPQ